MTGHQDLRDKIARVMYDEFNGLVADAWEREDSYERSYWLAQARAVLQATDAVVTVEQIRDEIAGHPIGSGYYQTAVGVDEAGEIAAIVQRLYRGEAALEAKTAEVEELRATLVELAPSAAIVLTEEVVVDGDVFTWGDLPDVLSRTGETLAEARREAKDQYIKRRDAEAALERVREAATEVASQGDNLGRTHYEKCWTQHLHCLAAKINFETGADDDTQP